MITTRTRRTKYSKRASLRIECPACSTAYDAARVNLLVDAAHATIVCMVCDAHFDVEISLYRNLLGKYVQVVTKVRD